MIYLYETIPGTEGEAVKRFEIKQSIHDAPLTNHPETGAPVRRVITGGIGLNLGKSAKALPPLRKPGCGCGHGGCCH